MRNVLNTNVRVRLGNESDVNGVKFVNGKIIAIEELSWSRSGRCNYYIELEDGLIAMSHWINDLPSMWQRVLTEQDVEYYSTCVLRRQQHEFLRTKEVIREATEQEILQLLQASGDIAKFRFISELVRDYSIGDLIDLDLADLRDMYEETLDLNTITEVIALPSGGCSRRTHKTKQVA